MAVIGIQLDRTNPEFTISDFTFWMPQFVSYAATEEGTAKINKIIAIANQKVFASIFGSDWEYAMSLVTAHYLTLIGQQMQTPAGSSLQSLSGGGSYKGLVESASVGGFNKTYRLEATLVESDDAKFWNQTSFGSQFMALYKTKSIPSMFVVTSNSIPGAR